MTIKELQEIINRFNPDVKVTKLPKFREEVRYSIDFENGLSIFITPEAIEMECLEESLWLRLSNKSIIIYKNNYTHVVL